MILFMLKCTAGHDFEAWFRNGEAYDRQAADSAISCPACGDNRVAKAPMAPRIARTDVITATEARARQLEVAVLNQVAEMQRKIEQNCDYVGSRFAEEARRIHYGETDAHSIYGEASPDEAEQLREEGVDFHKIPWLPPTDS
ncbi:Regulatory protein FmdB Zinc ribbon domain-containing protein [uncultured Gammaproteobacteria bacterium]